MNKTILLRLALLTGALLAPLTGWPQAPAPSTGRAQPPESLLAAERAQLLDGIAADLKKCDAEIAAVPRSVDDY